MNDQKCEKWRRDLEILWDAFVELRDFRQIRKVWLWALVSHPYIDDDGGIVGGDLVKVFSEAAAVLVRRIVKPHKDAASLLGLLQEIDEYYQLAERCFSRLPQHAEIKSDIDLIKHATEAVIAFVDEAYVHLDRSPKARLWHAYSKRDSALDVTIDMLEKYIDRLREHGVPPQIAIEESEIRKLFACPWIPENSDIPQYLIQGYSLFGNPYTWDDIEGGGDS